MRRPSDQPPLPIAIPVLLVGGGHASVYALRRAEQLRAAGAEVTLLTDRPYLLYSGMTPEWLGGLYTEDEVRVDLQAWCRRTGIRFAQGRAVHIDRAGRTVSTEDGRRFRADVMAVDVGAANPHRAAAGPATQTKPLHHIEQLARQLDRFERSRSDTPPFHLVIVGGGAAGCEVAMNVSARFAHRGDRFRLTLIDPGDRLVPAFPPPVADQIQTVLEARGANVRLGLQADRVEPAGDGRRQVYTDSASPLLADAVLWATGSRGPALFADGDWPTDDRGFLNVTKALRCRTAPWLLAAGDNAVVEGHAGLARVGVHAVKQGPVLFENLRRLIDGLARGERPESVRLASFTPYPVAPLLLSTGTDEAIGVAGPAWGRGTPLLRLKHFADRRWMRKYRFDAPRRPLLGAESATS